MNLAVDIGGTKTLLATFDHKNNIIAQQQFPTPEVYQDFMSQFKSCLSTLGARDVEAVAVGAPGVIDRQNGIGVSLGNLPWKRVPIGSDIGSYLNCQVFVENDAKLAAIYEASIVRDKYSRVFYVTIGTGIGLALVINGDLSNAISDTGGRYILIENNGELVSWEALASGSAIVKLFGEKAADIQDQNEWMIYIHHLLSGLYVLLPILEPEVVVIGGGVGSHFDRFGQLLVAKFGESKQKLNSIPAFIQATNSSEAVIYGGIKLIEARSDGTVV